MNKKNSDIDWAEIVDLFASEYGWTVEYTSSLTLGQIVLLMNKMQIRRDRQNTREGETSSTQDVGGVESVEEDAPMSYFEHKLGGKKVVEDGITKIIV